MLDGLDAGEVEELRRERRRRQRQRLSACCKSAVAFLFSHIGLAAMVVAYSIMGGFLFQAIEAPAEQSTKYRVRAARQRGIDEIWRLVAQLCDRRRRRRSVAEDTTTATGMDAASAAQIGAVLLEFQSEILHAVQDLGWDGNDDVTESKLQWSFAGALLYAVTVITTIGYGHIAPKTTLGRIITIVYALLGIPLTFLYLSNIGNFMANCFRMFYKRVCCDILCCQKCNRDRQRLRLKQRRQREMAVQRNILLGLHPVFLGCNPSDTAVETTAADRRDLTQMEMQQFSTENVAYSRSNSSSKNNDESDVENAAENRETERRCRNGCPVPQNANISTVSDGRILPPTSVRDGDSVSTLSSSSSSCDVTESESGRTNCSTLPVADDDKDSSMTSSTGATVRETAIVGGGSSDERLDVTGSCSDAVTLGASLIRRPLSRTTSGLRASSDVLRRDFATCLNSAPETDICFADSASDVCRNCRVTPEVETYLRLPPTTVCSPDINRVEQSPPSDDATCRNKAVEIDGRQADMTEDPEDDSTTSTAITMMSLSRRSSSLGAINLAAIRAVRAVHHPSVQRHSSVADRRRRPPRAPEAEIRRRVTSPLDRNAVTAALSADEERRSHARALANWAKLREQFAHHRSALDVPQLRAAAVRLLQDEARRSHSSDRRAPRRGRRSPSRRRRCDSTGAANRSKDANPPETVDNLPFHPTSDPREAAERAPIQNGSNDSVDLADATAYGSALPYDYEPLSFDDGDGGRLFTYSDDPFDYDETGGHDGGKVTVPITVCLIIIAGYIFAGAVLFTLWEDWDYLTGSYFCFITLSTIGFGDIVPGTDMDKWASSEKLVLCALWLAFGLSLLAMCFNLMQEEVKEKCKWIGLRVGLLRDEEEPQ